jgi:hypothetical protein
VNRGVTTYYMVSDGGSDPPMAEVLGLKSEQARGVVDPQQRENVVEAQVDMGRVKRMASAYLERRHGTERICASEAGGRRADV